MDFGRNIARVLCGDIDPLDIMFRDNLSERYYPAFIANDSHSHPVLEYMDLLSLEHPSVRILEVGAGTGGQTVRLSKIPSKHGQTWNKKVGTV